MIFQMQCYKQPLEQIGNEAELVSRSVTFMFKVQIHCPFPGLQLLREVSALQLKNADTKRHQSVFIKLTTCQQTQSNQIHKHTTNGCNATKYTNIVQILQMDALQTVTTHNHTYVVLIGSYLINVGMRSDDQLG